MFSILKQLKQQKEKLENLKGRYEAVKDLNNVYCGWTFAYRQTVIDLFNRGEITAEQKEMFFKRAIENYSIWQAQ